MKAIIGLGNIGKGYDNTYHNLGFKVVDALSKKVKAKFNIEKCKSLIAQAEYNGEEFLIVKPTTFMNASGQAVEQICKKYKIKTQDLIIVCDDIDIECGTYRFRTSGSGGTHNGLRNIIEVLQKDNFNRLRIGCGKDNSMPLKDYILSPIDPYKKETLNKVIDSASSFLLEFIFYTKEQMQNQTFKV